MLMYNGGRGQLCWCMYCIRNKHPEFQQLENELPWSLLKLNNHFLFTSVLAEFWKSWRPLRRCSGSYWRVNKRCRRLLQTFQPRFQWRSVPERTREIDERGRELECSWPTNIHRSCKRFKRLRWQQRSGWEIQMKLHFLTWMGNWSGIVLNQVHMAQGSKLSRSWDTYWAGCTASACTLKLWGAVTQKRPKIYWLTRIWWYQNTGSVEGGTGCSMTQ